MEMVTKLVRVRLSALFAVLTLCTVPGSIVAMQGQPSGNPGPGSNSGIPDLSSFANILPNFFQNLQGQPRTLEERQQEWKETFQVGIHGLRDALNEVDPVTGRAPVRDMVGQIVNDGLFGAAADAFAANGGQGDAAMNNFFTSAGRQFQEGGAADRAGNNMTGFIGRQANKLFAEGAEVFKKGGEADKAQQEASDRFGDITRNVTDHGVAAGDRLGSAGFRMTAKVSIGLAMGIPFAACSIYGLKVMWNHIERQLQKPRVIINQSAGWFERTFGKKPLLPPMINDEKLAQRLKALITETNDTRLQISKGNKQITYQNILLSGAPGSGKTMFARQFAQSTGMEFVEVTGSSFFQEGAGIKEIDSLFRWAQKSSRGLVIFIDEADSLLPDRTGLAAGSEGYRIVNHFLNYLGTRSKKFVVIAATNHKIIFDEAMERRFDDVVEFPLPVLKQRQDVLRLYKENIMLKSMYASIVDSAKELLTEQQLASMAQSTDGLSNGHLEGIIMAIYRSALSSDNKRITKEIITDKVAQCIEKHNSMKRRPNAHVNAHASAHGG